MILFSLNKPYEARLPLINRFSLVSKYLRGFMNVDANVEIYELSQTKKNRRKLICRQIQLDCTKLFFINDVVIEWNRIMPFMVQSNIINSL